MADEFGIDHLPGVALSTKCHRVEDRDRAYHWTQNSEFEAKLGKVTKPSASSNRRRYCSKSYWTRDVYLDRPVRPIGGASDDRDLEVAR